MTLSESYRMPPRVGVTPVTICRFSAPADRLPFGLRPMHDGRHRGGVRRPSKQQAWSAARRGTTRRVPRRSHRPDQRRLKDGRFALERGREHRLSHYRGTNLRYRAGFVFSKRIVLNRFCQQRCTQVITSARGGGRRPSGLHPPCLQPGGRLYGRAAHVRRLPIQ